MNNERLVKIMNKVILLGRLTKDPEIRLSQKNNTKVASFTLAVNRKYAAEGEERQTDFINIVAFSKLAEFAEKYLRQGLQIALCGRLQIRSYEDTNGQKKYVTEVIAEEIDFADSIKRTDDTSILNAGSTNSNEQNAENSDVTVIGDDDLPF